jgi:two-component system phosphate regulon response regulator PhoB
VQRLRAKLGDAGEFIETVRGFGYRLRASAGRGG